MTLDLEGVECSVCAGPLRVEQWPFLSCWWCHRLFRFQPDAANVARIVRDWLTEAVLLKQDEPGPLRTTIEPGDLDGEGKAS